MKENLKVISFIGLFTSWLPGLAPNEQKEVLMGGWLIPDDIGGFGGSMVDQFGSSVIRGDYESGNVMILIKNYTNAVRYAPKEQINIRLEFVSINKWEGTWETEHMRGRVKMVLGEPLSILSLHQF